MEKLDQVEKELESNSSDRHPLSIDNDALTKVFGKDFGGHIRSVGSISKSEYDVILHGYVMWLEERAEKDAFIKSIGPKLDLFVEFYNKYIAQGQTPSEASPLTQMMKNFTPGPASSLEENSVTSGRNEPSSGSRLCELLDWEGHCVALAREVTDPMHHGNCHSYVLDTQIEIKVSMVTRKMFKVKLYKAEKNPDANTIGDVEAGDFLCGQSRTLDSWNRGRLMSAYCFGVVAATL